jgi:hypothetical protein
MLIRYQDLEAYYLQRRLDFLHILDGFANESFNDEDFHMPDDHPKIMILENEYSDVIDPSHLCQTLKRIYPDHLFGIKRRK